MTHHEKPRGVVDCSLRVDVDDGIEYLVKDEQLSWVWDDCARNEHDHERSIDRLVGQMGQGGGGGRGGGGERQFEIKTTKGKNKAKNTCT